MNLDKFEKELESVSKSEEEMFKEFLFEASGNARHNEEPSSSSSIEAKASDLKLDQIVEITQELSDGRVNRFKFKIIEIWPTPGKFFTVMSLAKPNDDLNYWTLFYDGTWYIKKTNKSLINVHVKLV